ncbi:PQQ-dependent sugar dehydrogenase [Segetibacter koreensis]|uniref:PQQ-dependent sugar dehydrogenase n=1 Tax=Segetibacter koreensis TaxID=398037 RepID=UPI00036DBFB3|nr:PQQ-dependent sugar dehydrogenase [Segetibacter koreensis]
MKKLILKSSLIIASFAITQFAFSQSGNLSAVKNTGASTAPRLHLPAGFTSTVVAENIDAARHMAVNKQGNLYVKLSRLKDGKGIIYLKDTNGDGKFDEQMAFGDYPGTGICIKNDYLYASSNDDVYRYKLDNNGEVINPNKPEKIIEGLVNRDRDNSKAIAVDNSGNIYVNVGSYINACLVDPNAEKAPYPCPLLDSVGGIWRFKTNKLNQQYKDAIHYATGFKNVVGIDWNTKTNSLFIMQHGRDLYPKYLTAEQSSMLPAETMYEVHKGSNGGWPYVYYDHFQHKKMLSPEYGGDGKKTGGKNALDPLVAFPAHLAPNDLIFYTGNKFPEKYKNGAFIAFHGNSAELHKGYVVAFVPFKNGKPSGKWQIFADNFTTEKEQHKPCGLAQGPDGSLYVSDDAKGTIYRLQYKK